MLNGEGNEKGKILKTKTKGLISEKETSLHVQHMFLYIFMLIST